MLTKKILIIILLLILIFISFFKETFTGFRNNGNMTEFKIDNNLFPMIPNNYLCYNNKKK